MKEELKAVEECAKVAGKGLDIADKAGSFISTLIKGPLEQGIGIFEDKLKYIRWERQNRLIMRANEFIKDQNINETRPLQLKYAIPLLQSACWEEEDYLQDLWAQLLVNAIDVEKTEIKRIYIDILECLSTLEVKILDKIYNYSFEDIRHKTILTYQLPDSIEFQNPNMKYPKLNNIEVELALCNLARLGCISIAKSVGGGEIYSLINVTLLGKSFCEACSLKK